MNYALIVPTFNAEKYIRQLIESVQAQTCPPTEIQIIDSQSEDKTVEIAESYSNVIVYAINKNEFDHGKTRDWAIRNCVFDFVVLMTQDAIPCESNCMEELIKPFNNSQIAAVTARQIPRTDSKEYEKAIRHFRYPEKSIIWSKEDIKRLGMRAFLISDVCAAYRIEAYINVGGFAYPLSTNEDMLIASSFLKAGYKLSYCAEARVYHSHDYTFLQEYKRNKLIGAFMEQYGKRFGTKGETGEGKKLVASVSKELIKKRKFFSCLCFYWNCLARILGNKIGHISKLKDNKTNG